MTVAPASAKAQFEDFERRADGARNDLFEAIRAVDESQFGLALMPEMRAYRMPAGKQQPTQAVLDQYIELKGCLHVGRTPK